MLLILLLIKCILYMFHALVQGYSNLSREIHFPAEFSPNPN